MKPIAKSSGGWVSVGGKPVLLEHPAPKVGRRLEASFEIPPGRNTQTPLTATDLCAGAVVVSTLPNIAAHACFVQVLDLEERLYRTLPGTALVHVASDAPEAWSEVDYHHANLTARGYTLCGATNESGTAFRAAFGVGVAGRTRIAHGLFALLGGEFVVVDIPREQLGTPDVRRFLRAVTRAFTTRAQRMAAT